MRMLASDEHTKSTADGIIARLTPAELKLNFDRGRIMYA
jgi:hypothetical protein